MFYEREKEELLDKNSHHKQLVFYEDPLGLLELGVLPLVAPSQVVHVKQHHLERKRSLERKKKRKGYLDGSGHPRLLLDSPVLL